MLTAKDIMSTELITVSPDMEITRATALLLEKRINGVPVVNENGELLGILCQSDLVAQQKRLPLPSFFTFLDGFIPLTSMKQIEKQLQKVAAITVSQAMTPEPIAVSPDTELSSIATLMVDRNFHTLPVVKDGKLLGIIGKEDILRTLMSQNIDSEDLKKSEE